MNRIAQIQIVNFIKTRRKQARFGSVQRFANRRTGANLASAGAERLVQNGRNRPLSDAQIVIA